MASKTNLTCMLTCLILVSFDSKFSEACCANITVAVLVERSAVLDFPFQINRTVGIIELAMNKSREMLADVANLEFIIRYADVPTCTSLHWGALAADIYHNNKIHAIIGPGKYYCTSFKSEIFCICPMEACMGFVIYVLFN